jgi:hypothetical protein
MKNRHAHFYEIQYSATHAMTWERRRPCLLVSGTVLDNTCNDRRGVNRPCSPSYCIRHSSTLLCVPWHERRRDFSSHPNQTIHLSGFGSFKQPNENIWVHRISPGLLAPQVMEAINSESLKSTSVECWGQGRGEANAFLATYISAFF